MRMLQIKSNTPSKQSLAGGVLYLCLRVGCAVIACRAENWLLRLIFIPLSDN